MYQHHDWRCRKYWFVLLLFSLFLLDIDLIQSLEEHIAQTTGYICDLLRIAEVIHPESRLCVTQYLFLHRRIPITDPLLSSILFSQLRFEFLKGQLLCSEEDAITLASHLMQYFNGDFIEDKPISPNPYIPDQLKNKMSSSSELSSKVNAEHFTLMGNDKDKTCRNFISHCQYFQHFGSFHAEVEIVSSFSVFYYFTFT